MFVRDIQLNTPSRPLLFLLSFSHCGCSLYLSSLFILYSPIYNTYIFSYLCPPLSPFYFMYSSHYSTSSSLSFFSSSFLSSLLFILPLLLLLRAQSQLDCIRRQLESYSFLLLLFNLMSGSWMLPEATFEVPNVFSFIK